MPQLTPISSRKRPSPDDEATQHASNTFSHRSSKPQHASNTLSHRSSKPQHASNTLSPRSPKRQRILSPSNASPPGLRISIPGKDAPMTPPLSAADAATMALKLVIPQNQSSREQQKKLNRRRADAVRWESKLQRPFPRLGEIKAAYPLKLMRHYPDANASVRSNFVRPPIDRSARVERLLKQFPLVETDTHHSGRLVSPVDEANPLSARREQLGAVQSEHMRLQMNQLITGSEHAQRLAWRSFSLPERGRVDRGREAMMQSGLATDDLGREAVGERNQLPEWKKPHTGRFAKGVKQPDSGRLGRQ